MNYQIYNFSVDINVHARAGTVQFWNITILINKEGGFQTFQIYLRFLIYYPKQILNHTTWFFISLSQSQDSSQEDEAVFYCTDFHSVLYSFVNEAL